VAVIVSGKGGVKGGLDSREAVVTDTLAAMTRGDADRLIALIAPENEYQLVSCDEAGLKGRDPPEMVLGKLREQSTRAIDKARGLQIELVKLVEGKAKTDDKGKELEKGCTLSVTIVLHD